MRRVLVTGVTGFVGANLAKALYERGYEVFGLARSIKEHSSYRLLNVDINMMFGDVRDRSLIYNIIIRNDIDVIYHLAAVAIVKQAHKDPWFTVETNIMGTLSVLEACRELGCSVIYMSTDKVYGEGLRKLETDPYNPVDIYGATKASADLIARIYAKTYDVNVVVARSCNVYGPGDTNPRIIPNTIRKCLKGEKPFIYKNYKGAREYIYIDDLVNALIFLGQRINNLMVRREVFNIGTGEVKTQEEVVLEITKHFKTEPVYIEPPPDLKIEINEQSLDYSKIYALGWRPEVKFSEGIKRTIEWWRAVVRSGRLRI